MYAQFIDRGDPWKSKARILQLRFKERFRVAVDRHGLRPAIFLPEGYVSSTVHRWLRRFRDFRRDSLPSSSAFYRKRVSGDIDAEESAIFRMLQAVAVPLLGNVCHVFMNGLNSVQVYGLEKLHESLLNRPNNKSLLTVSNHVASVDDPFVIASLLPPGVLLDAQNLRWTLCATDRCFRNPVTSAFFQSVKVLPVSRGDGIYQKGMDMAISKLNRGGWVHIFPEGSRSRDGGKTMGNAKRGVGRLILDADSIPIVVPFVHSGMQDIMPVGASFPRIGKMVTVIIGDPINFDDLLTAEEAKDLTRSKLYDAVASRISQRLHQLKTQVDNLALKQSNRSQNYNVWNAERANDIVQHIDWDSFGMGTHHDVIRDDADDSVGPEKDVQSNLSSRFQEKNDTCCRRLNDVRVRFSFDGGFVSRVRSLYMDRTELMGFAARGVFMNNRDKETAASNNNRRSKMNPLTAWKQLLDANLLQQLKGY